MLMDEYFSAMKNVLTKAENTQREAILAAADEIANRLEKGGAWHIMDTGHMLMFEAVGRTGGMMAIKPIKITCEIQNPVRYRLAIKANEMGCATIALTSVEYSSHLTSKHPSGKRLFEACTYCIDNCTNYGATLVDVPALGQSICPASGISASYLMWALQSTVVEKLLAKGLKPSVYISNHMPNAPKINGEALERYNEFGY